jgi:hypothetical protein
MIKANALRTLAVITRPAVGPISVVLMATCLVDAYATVSAVAAQLPRDPVAHQSTKRRRVLTGGGLLFRADPRTGAIMTDRWQGGGPFQLAPWFATLEALNVPVTRADLRAELPWREPLRWWSETASA